MSRNELSYRNAMSELSQIMGRLKEAEDVDVDELVRDVARAKELIQFCDGKIRNADAEIKTIVSELAPVPDPDGPAFGEEDASPRRESEDIPF